MEEIVDNIVRAASEWASKSNEFDSILLDDLNWAAVPEWGRQANSVRQSYWMPPTWHSQA